MTSYTVVAPLVIVRCDDATTQYVYSGGVLPESANAEHVAELLEGGLIAEVGDDGLVVEEIEKVPADEPEPVTDPAEDDLLGTEPPAKPHGNAGYDAWAEYARAMGASEEDLAGLSRDEIRSLYTD